MRSVTSVVLAALLVALLAAPAGAYVIQPGDTLSGIAVRHGVSSRSIIEANGLADPDVIVAGASLTIPGAGNTGDAAAGSTSSAAPAPSVPAGRSHVRDLIVDAAHRHGWRPAVPLGLAMQESGWNNSVVSPAGAIGIMQVLPGTADWVELFLLRRPVDLHDPADNVAAGMAYLDHLYGRFDGDVVDTLAAYFEGPRRVAERGPSDAARRYVANVLALADRYR